MSLWRDRHPPSTDTVVKARLEREHFILVAEALARENAARLRYLLQKEEETILRRGEQTS